MIIAIASFYRRWSEGLLGFNMGYVNVVSLADVC